MNSQYPQQNPNYQQPNNSPQMPNNPGKGLGVASMVLGILGLCTGWLYGIGCVLGIIGIVLAVASGNKSKAAGLGWSGLATAGLVCAIIATCTGAGCLICTVCVSGSACAAANSANTLANYGYYYY